MNQFQTRCITLLTSGFFALCVYAESRYVTDIIYIPMRSGPGSQYRIIHQGIKTGTELKVLEADAGNNYSKVVTPDGLEGYIRTQYMQNNPPARQQLPALEAAANKAASDKTLIVAELEQAKMDQETLAEKLREVTGNLEQKNMELKRITTISADTLVIDQRNKNLVEENLQLKNRVQLLETDNKQLISDSRVKWFIYGGGTVVIGVLLGLLLPRLRIRKKPASDWI
ncbi:TIGR04211 family SH3 domain-containing protein [Candidatus Sororendozoicomonas aggregata]|uniref:TIGR04211 family SH3 domain-containing protein n=1 Tax=Candidatus Sororendozoicomonas aggregata TaxID=3073239 RepID=UPI002ED6AA9A